MPRPPKETVLSKKQLGERVRTLREQRGLSQGQLAEIVGTHPQSLSQVKRGIRSLTLQQVVLLRRVRRIQELPPAQRAAVLDLLAGALRMSRAERGQ